MQETWKKDWEWLSSFQKSRRSDSPMVVPCFNLSGPGRMDWVLKMRKQKGGVKIEWLHRVTMAVGGRWYFWAVLLEEETDALEQMQTTDSASLATNVGTIHTGFDIQWTLHREVGGDNATGVSLSLAQTHSITISLEGTPTKYSMLRRTSKPNWVNASRTRVRPAVEDRSNTTACGKTIRLLGAVSKRESIILTRSLQIGLWRIP